MNNFCGCGCGEATKPKRLFITGHNLKGATRKPRVQKECIQCKKTFEGTEASMKARSYCSTACRDAHRREQAGSESHPKRKRVEVACATCGTTLHVIPSSLDRRENQYCSKECSKEGRSKNLMQVEYPASHWRTLAHREYGRACAVCGFDFFVDVHHITPKSKGGGNEIGNLVPLCPNHHHMAHAGAFTDEELHRHQAKAAQAEAARRASSPTRIGRVQAKARAAAKIKGEPKH